MSTLRVTIVGVDMPGRSCEPADAGRTYADVHVGVQWRQDVVDLVPGDADGARWTFDVTTRSTDGGARDFGGPYVQGRRGDRFLYLSWGTVGPAGGFEMFRRAKLHFADVPDAVLTAAGSTGGLTATVRMSDDRGNPRCARVRHPDIDWSAS